MDLFDAAQGDGRLNPAAFDDAVRRGTRDFAEVLDALRRTGGGQAEVVHFLMALGRVRGGATADGLARRGLTADQWYDGLAACARGGDRAAAPRQVNGKTLDPGAQRMLHAARERAERERAATIAEPVLLLAALSTLTDPPEQTPPPDWWTAADPARDLLASVDAAGWKADLEAAINPPPPLPVFDEKGAVVRGSFSRGGDRVLTLLQDETQALGYDAADPRHLLLALLGWDGGATQYGLFLQGVVPRKAHEAVMLNLRSRARKTRSAVPLDRAHLQPTLAHVLARAGELAGDDRADRVTEAHLLRAFLAVPSTALQLLADQGVDPAELRKTAEGFEPDAEGGADASGAAADTATIEARLKARLVGQDAAVGQIMPYVELMRFGLKTPGHPVGVFLFCGPSGCGKTEMAKELARSVYGDEEALVFLEMGQFNTPESMTIFVGAPPGYIGYGEGKLTNGLRDKPRSVVLFDEVEKARGKVYDALLRFLDEGRIDDPAGPVRDGTQCIVVLTSNVAADSIDQIWERWAGKPNARAEIRRELREKFLAAPPPGTSPQEPFRVEFLNRVDEVILFKKLTPADYVEIARRALDGFRKSMAEEFQVEMADAGTGRPLGERLPKPAAAAAEQAIGAYCAELNEGARAVTRVARTAVLLPVCRYVATNQCPRPAKVKVRVTRAAGPGNEPVGAVEPG